MELIVTSAIGCQIGQDPHGLRLVKVQETEVEHASPFPEVWLLQSMWILASNGRSDNNLYVFTPTWNKNKNLIFQLVGEWLKIAE